MHNVRQAACGLGLALLAGCASIGAGAEDSVTAATAPASAPATPGGGQTLAGVDPTPGAGPPEKPETDAPASPDKEKQQPAGAPPSSALRYAILFAGVVIVLAAIVALGGGGAGSCNSICFTNP